MIELLRFTGGPVVILGIIGAWRHGLGTLPAWFLTALFAFEVYLSNALGQPVFQEKIRQKNERIRARLICFSELIVQMFILIAFLTSL